MVTATSGTTACETLKQHCHVIVGMLLAVCPARKSCSAEDGVGVRGCHLLRNKQQLLPSSVRLRR